MNQIERLKTKCCIGVCLSRGIFIQRDKGEGLFFRMENL